MQHCLLQTTLHFECLEFIVAQNRLFHPLTTSSRVGLEPHCRKQQHI